MKFEELFERERKLNSCFGFPFSSDTHIASNSFIFVDFLGLVSSRARSLEELTVFYSHGSPLDSIVVVSISDDPTNVRFRCVCCRDYVRRELDAVTSSGISFTVSKVIHDFLGFNWTSVAIQALQNIHEFDRFQLS